MHKRQPLVANREMVPGGDGGIAVCVRCLTFAFGCINCSSTNAGSLRLAWHGSSGLAQNASGSGTSGARRALGGAVTRALTRSSRGSGAAGAPTGGDLRSLRWTLVAEPDPEARPVGG